ncbi:ABC transporter permease [Clostridium amazonitimonense]|uniref:ABC transporter permease n=1 Tax=Clostridium amazonitimonense TaxID=1499689 RepID=UPI00050941C8|nr:ABC transporter permease subunit [Clostridium amazonitimonense]
MKILKYQLLKELKQRKNIVIFFGMVLYCIALIFYMNYSNTKYIEKIYNFNENAVLEYTGAANGAKIELIALKEEYKDNESDPVYKKKWEEIDKKIELYQSLYINYLSRENGYFKLKYGKVLEDEDLKTILKSSKSINQVIIKGVENSVVDNLWLKERGFEKEEIEKQIADYQEIQDKGNEFQISPYTLNMANYLRRFFDQINVFILLVVVLMLSIESYTSEFEEGSYKTIYAAPYNRRSLIRSKYIARSLLNICLVLVPLLMVTISVGIIYGFGDLSYPVRMNESIEHFSLFITSNQEVYISVLKTLGIQVVSMIALIIFQTIMGISASVLIQDSTASFGAILAILLITYMSTMINSFSRILRFINPWSYMDLQNIFFSKYKTTQAYGIIIQIVVIGLITFITTKVFEKRDLSGGVA